MVRNYILLQALPKNAIELTFLIILLTTPQASMETDLRKSLFASTPKSPIQNGRPSSMVVKVTQVLPHLNLESSPIHVLFGIKI